MGDPAQAPYLDLAYAAPPAPAAAPAALYTDCLDHSDYDSNYTIQHIDFLRDIRNE